MTVILAMKSSIQGMVAEILKLGSRLLTKR